MQRYFLKLAYNGAAYHGWQVQPNSISVQEVLEKGVSFILRTPISIVGCGRTDTGVHAHIYYAHFDTAAEFDVSQLVKRLNRFLYNDIVVYDCFRVPDDLHARFSAIYRTYHYHLTSQKNPFNTAFSYQLFREVDFEKMNEAALELFDFIDFSAFSKSNTQTMTNNCRVTEAKWEKNEEPGLWTFTITADRFLRNMVRAIVGTLLEVGYGKLSTQDFRSIIESKDRKRAGASVPAHGLFLHDVGYPTELFNYENRTAGSCHPSKE